MSHICCLQKIEFIKFDLSFLIYITQYGMRKANEERTDVVLDKNVKSE